MYNTTDCMSTTSSDLVVRCCDCDVDDIMFCECSAEFNREEHKVSIPIRLSPTHERPRSPPIPIPNEHHMLHGTIDLDAKVQMEMFLRIKTLESRVRTLEEQTNSNSKSTSLKVTHRRSSSW